VKHAHYVKEANKDYEAENDASKRNTALQKQAISLKKASHKDRKTTFIHTNREKATQLLTDHDGVVSAIDQYMLHQTHGITR